MPAQIVPPVDVQVPPMRCQSVHSDLAPMADSVACHDLSTITITYAKRMLRLIEDKVRGWTDLCSPHPRVSL